MHTSAAPAVGQFAPPATFQNQFLRQSYEIQGKRNATPPVQARALELEGASVAGHLQQLMLTRDKSGAGLDLRSLGIITGKACWVLYIDCIVLSSGGSLLVALSAAIHKALQSTSIPRVSVDTSIEDATAEDIEVDADAFTRMQLDTSRLPVVLTPCQVRELPAHRSDTHRAGRLACCGRY